MWLPQVGHQGLISWLPFAPRSGTYGGHEVDLRLYTDTVTGAVADSITIDPAAFTG